MSSSVVESAVQGTAALDPEGLGFTNAEMACLNWSADCNRRRVGFLYPTVWKFGSVAEYDRLVREGYVRVVDRGAACRSREGYGYWLTDKGFAAQKASRRRGSQAPHPEE